MHSSFNKIFLTIIPNFNDLSFLNIYTLFLTTCFIEALQKDKSAIKNSITRHSSNNITSYSWLTYWTKSWACTTRGGCRFCRQCDTCHGKLPRVICRKLQTKPYSLSSALRLTWQELTETVINSVIKLNRSLS